MTTPRIVPGPRRRPNPVRLLALALALFVLFSGAAMAITGRLGIANVQATEVAVVVNYLTGSTEVVQQPGYKLYIPFLQSIYTFDRTTQEFVMAGNRNVDHNHVSLLTVRASDGSNFRIDDLTILYEIIPGEADLILSDSGPGTGYKEDWIKAYARSILRDEFGRYSAVEVANPTVYKQAPAAAAERLNRLLRPHGIRIVRIITPNPQFDPQYERAIEERKNSDQEVERLIAEAERLEQLRAQRLAAVNKSKEVEQQELEGELTRQLLAAEERKIAVVKEADVYATERKAAGEAMLAELTNQARGMEAKYRKEAEGIETRAQALAERGSVVVREAVIERLKHIRFTLLPYSRDPNPRRLEHVDAANANAVLGSGD